MIIEIKKLGMCDNPIHPDSNYGDTKESFIGKAIFGKPKIGDVFILVPNGNIYNADIKTSKITEVTETTFTTMNSVYSWVVIEE